MREYNLRAQEIELTKQMKTTSLITSSQVVRAIFMTVAVMTWASKNFPK